MLQIKDLTITHRKDFRIILEKFNLTLNDKDKAVIIGEEGNGKSTLMKWIYDQSMAEEYTECEGELITSGPVIRKMISLFPGAVISISHDRKYIDEVCTKVYTLTENGLE